MKYLTIQDIINAQLVERCVSKYMAGESDYLKEEAVQHCWLKILESNHGAAKCLECWVITIIKNQLLSKTSEFYKEIKRYEKSKVYDRHSREIGEACEIADD